MGCDPFDGITIVLCEVAVNNMRENLAMVVLAVSLRGTLLLLQTYQWVFARKKLVL
jgi:hypothetical protein